MKIAFCITNRNRTQHLKQTLPKNLADNPSSVFVVLDYNTEDDLLEYLWSAHRDFLESGRLVVYHYFDAPKFRMAHAKNMAHRLGIREGADVLVNLDADNMTGPGFEGFIVDKLAGRGDAFLWSSMVKGVMTRGINGRIAVTRQQFLRAGGYDQKFDAWGSDDKDFNIRLRMLGYEGIEIDPKYLLAVAHNDRMRFKDYPQAGLLSDEYFRIPRGSIKRPIANAGWFGCGTVYRNFDFTVPIRVDPPTRVFGIGMHKTATTSLGQALTSLGYNTWHWTSAHAAKAIWRGMNQDGFSDLLEGYDALCDLPIPLLYERLDRSYPGSKFVLTIREGHRWLEATRRHFDPNWNRWCTGWDQDPFTHRIHQILYGRKTFDSDVMLARYRAHNAAVIDYFRGRPHDLLVLDMEKSTQWDDLCGFLRRPIPDELYPRVNGTGN